MSETRAQLRERLKWEERLPAFERRLAELMFEVETEAEAWALASKEFPPREDIVKSPEARKREWQEKLKADQKARRQKKHDDQAATIVKEKLSGRLNAPARKVIQFVFDHLDVQDVRPEDAPSSGAWSMLQECRLNPGFRQDFLKTIYPKLLPTKAQIDAEHSANQDDGRAIFRALEAVRRASAEARSSLPSGAEGSGAES